MMVRFQSGDRQHTIAHKLNGKALPTTVGFMTLYLPHSNFERIFQRTLLQLFSKAITGYFGAWKPIAT